MRTTLRTGIFYAATVLLLLCSLGAQAREEEKLTMKVGDTHVVTVAEHTTVIPGNEKVIKVVARGSQVVLKAIMEGYSTVTIGDKIYRVTVYGENSLKELRDLFEEMLIDIEGIQVRLAADRVFIDGEVLTQADKDRVDALAAPFLGLVLSMVTLDPRVVEKKPMFRIAFDFVEVDRQKAKQYGMNLSGNLASMVFDWMDVIRNGPTVQLDNMINFNATQAFTRVWESHEATVLNGATSHYQYGGTLLIPVQTANTANLVEKEFGIFLDVTPRIDRRDNVVMDVYYEVSDLNTFEEGTFILTKKSQETTVLLKEGQSLALAGVVRHKSKRELAGLPWLQEVPLLGAFFSTRAFEKGDTDGVVFITPYLIDPDGDENQDLIDRNLDKYREMKMLP